MNKHILITILFLFIILSCEDKNKTIKHFYKNGKIKEVEFYNNDNKIKRKISISLKGKTESDIFYQNGSIIKSKFFENQRLTREFNLENHLNSSEIWYFDNINIYGNGIVDNHTRQIGWWIYKNNKGHLMRKREFLIFEHDQFLNQELIYNYNGSINRKYSKYVKFNFKHTKKREYLLMLVFNNPINEKSKVILCHNKNLTSNFNNVHDVSLSSFILKKNKINNIPVSFTSKGKKSFRAILLEEPFEASKNKNLKPLMFINCIIDVK